MLDDKNSVTLKAPVTLTLNGFNWFGSDMASVKLQDSSVMLFVGSPGYGPIYQEEGSIYAFQSNGKGSFRLKYSKRGGKEFVAFGSKLEIVKIDNGESFLAVASPSLEVPDESGNSEKGWQTGCISFFKIDLSNGIIGVNSELRIFGPSQASQFGSSFFQLLDGGKVFVADPSYCNGNSRSFEMNA